MGTMGWIQEALARIGGMFTKNAADDDLRAELEMHVEMETAENVRRGMAPLVMIMIATSSSETACS